MVHDDAQFDELGQVGAGSDVPGQPEPTPQERVKLCLDMIRLALEKTGCRVELRIHSSTLENQPHRVLQEASWHVAANE